MGKYAISFDLRWNDTYSERYESLMAEINKCARVWKETTSFALVETAETLTALERRLWLSKFSSVTDILFVVDVSGDSCTIRGATMSRPALKAIMPQVQEP